MGVDFSRDVYCLLGLPFDAVDGADAVRRLRQASRERRACFLSTPNVNFLIGCRADSRFRDSVVRSDLCIVDGMPLVWIARLLGLPIRERVAGSTVFESLRHDPAERMSIFFFGGADGVAEAACRTINAESGGLFCAGFESPGFGTIDEMSGDATIAKINASGADFLVVSLGARKGQAWIERNRPRLSVPLVGHLGAVPNFVAGTVARAPAWLQRYGLEWLWRIKEEPALWRRYLGDGMALFGLLVARVLPYAWFLRRHAPAADRLAAAGLQMAAESGCCTVRLRGAWTRSTLGPLRECLGEVASRRSDVALDLAAVDYVDSAFIALVMLLHCHLTAQRCRLRLVGARQLVRKVVRYCCAEYLLES